MNCLIIMLLSPCFIHSHCLGPSRNAIGGGALCDDPNNGRKRD